ncbi:MAG TPA: acyl-CoA reductase, partial [Bacteroidales bacterium]
MILNKRIDAFSELGIQIREISSGKNNSSLSRSAKTLEQLIFESKNYNGWFTPENVAHMLKEIGNCLTRESIEKWLQFYRPKIEELDTTKKIAVVMAGNIPAVGFNDFLSVLISGNSILAKLSSDDNKILPAIAELLIE